MNRQAIKILSLALVLAASSSVAFAQKVWKGSWATAVEWTVHFVNLLILKKS